MKPVHECPLWEWTPGMLDDYGDRVLSVNAEGNGLIVHASEGALDGHEARASQPGSMFKPRRDDPATLGALMGLVREMYGKPRAFCRFVETGDMGSGVGYWHVNTGHTGPTEWDAWAAALWAAVDAGKPVAKTDAATCRERGS